MDPGGSVRIAEIRNVIRITFQKTKNNLVPIGEPGVGKTAVVEGLAQRIVRGDVPEGLKDKEIILTGYSLCRGCEIPWWSLRNALKAVLDEREEKSVGTDHFVHR